MSVNPFDPHPPFDPPQEFMNRYSPTEMPYPLFKKEDIEGQKAFKDIDQPILVKFDSFENPSKSHNNFNPRMAKACYYATIELLDEQFGRIMDTLKKTGQLHDTIVIFTSDHGELLGDHGLLSKGCRFFESLVHVPLIISWPGHFKKGMRSDALVELVDLAPTLLDALGLPLPQCMHGKSLVPILCGDVDPHYHKPSVISEYNDALPLPNSSHGTMYFNGRYKTIVYHGTDLGEFYDLEVDPGEFNNLWNDRASHKTKQELLKKHFDAIMDTSSAGVSRSGSY